MKDYLQKIKSILDKLKARKISYNRGGINPSRDWRFILSSVSIILFVLAIFALYFYVQIDRGSFFYTNIVSTENDIKIDQKLLNKTIENMKIRQNRSDDLLNGQVSIPSDPSL